MYGIRRALQYTYESMVYNCGEIQSHAMVRYMNEPFLYFEVLSQQIL